MPNSALLIMDVQRGIVERIGGSPEYLERLRLAAEQARGAGVAVIHVVVGFREGHPEISPANLTFSRMIGTDAFTPSDDGAEIHPAVAPRPEDITVTKKRVSAFAGSGLETLLRGSGINTLVLCGIATSGVVLSTVRQAADLDFRLVVLEDGCLDADARVHEVLTADVFPRQAEVTSVEKWIATLS